MTVAVPVELTPRSGRETALPATASRGQSASHATPALLPLDAGEQYRFGFSMSACVGCHSCEVACSEQNGLPAGLAWRRVGEIEGGTFPSTRRFHISMSCNHCLEPACLDGCPTNAYEKLPNGIVAHHADDCIGCQYCTWNCPYSVPAFQPDRRIVTKCDMCQPRLAEGLTPACVDACPTHAITVEKVDVAAWRADHSEGNGPELPSASLTISTTRIELPADVPIETYAASDWDLRPEHPHWPLVWLTVLSQLAVGTSATVGSTAGRVLAATLAAAALVGALFHLGRPAAAWKALRNLRRSWLSREVALLGAYAALAAVAVVAPALSTAATAVGALGVYASARLYIVPGRPAWDTPLTIAAFGATALASGPLLTDHRALAAVGLALSVVAVVANWLRLAGSDDVCRWGTVRLSLRWFAPWTALRMLCSASGLAFALVGAPLPIVLGLVVAGEVLGRWLFFVTVVPRNMPGSFWRGVP